MCRIPYATAFQRVQSLSSVPWALSSPVAFQRNNQVKNMQASASVYIGTISYSDLKQQRKVLFPEEFA